MKAAFSVWNDRIAPVFDVARRLHLVPVEPEHPLGETQDILMDEESSADPVLRLAALNVTTLVCGAISRPLHHRLLASGIWVIPFIAGDLRSVIEAWRHDRLNTDHFAMPGCRGWQMKHRSIGLTCHATPDRDPSSNHHSRFRLQRCVMPGRNRRGFRKMEGANPQADSGTGNGPRLGRIASGFRPLAGRGRGGRCGIEGAGGQDRYPDTARLGSAPYHPTANLRMKLDLILERLDELETRLPKS